MGERSLLWFDPILMDYICQDPILKFSHVLNVGGQDCHAGIGGK